MSDPVIDLRSDTVTRPGPKMREAMASAEVGDDVWGDDFTVKALEAQSAALLGHEEGLFVPSGTQSNLVALLTHCARGEEYIVGQTAHTYKYEAGGAAVLGSIQPQPIEFEPDGSLDLDMVRAKIKPDNEHFAITKLLSLENTQDGRVLPLDYLAAARELATEHGLSFHLDGARLWNAASALQIPESQIAGLFDSVSVCLSKGLGAPVGSVLVGSSEFITRARRWRKMLGGGLRQAGVLAAAGIYALDNHRERVADDHAMAVQIGDALADVEGVEILATNTNMVFCNFDNYAGDATARFETNGIIARVLPGESRLVTHLDLPTDTPSKLVSALV